MVLPGRNPVLVAKELASLDRLSGGRLLPAFGLGVADAHEQQAFGVARNERAAWFDEALPLIRRFWTEDAVDHDGPRFHYEGVRVLPKPDPAAAGRVARRHRPVGAAPGRAAGRRLAPLVRAPRRRGRRPAGHRGDAADHDRAIDPEHFGVLVPYADGPLSDGWPRSSAARRPEVDARDLMAGGLTACGPSSRPTSPSVRRSSWCCPWPLPPTGTRSSSRLAEVVLPLQQS